MAQKEQRELDREAEEKRNKAIEDAVAERNARIAAGEDPDQSGVSGGTIVTSPNSQGKAKG
jgi:regulator of protease activity HflC (stomatin/prohibitin superfamily)